MNYFLYCRKSTEDEDRQVLSLQSQVNEAVRAFGGPGEIKIVDRFVEAMSAKRPGRPIFNEMLSRLEGGEADGVIAWAPDRLARNSVDGGSIIYLLDRGVIRDLKFVTYTFENNSQGKFMLQIMFGQSKYFSDALSENVKRGNWTKVEGGWRPNRAPLGYQNDRATKTITADPALFPLVRRMYDLALTGAYSCAQITRIARDDWGMRTAKRKRTGGTLVAPATIHYVLTNPFYAGSIVWGGQTYQGNHTPVVSIGEFDAVQRILRRSARIRAPRRIFPYTGMIRCGECGFSITAEEKVNRHGSHYLYYHCTRRSMGPKCRQRSLTAKGLEAQLFKFLESLTVHESIERWVLERVAKEMDGDAEVEEARKNSLQRSIASIDAERRPHCGLPRLCAL
jgi:DNA invertase Pin-like site-specific DNA recombinase